MAGISGGIDSVCLFYVLLELKEVLSFDLCAVHVEHGIRGESSRRDERFVRELCEKEHVSLRVFNENVPELARKQGLSLEEAARLIRYRDFDTALTEAGADKIAVAHHMNDQAETFLFNLIRGSSLRGLSGMSPLRGKIIRPLLNCARSEIEEYAACMGLEYVTDESNRDESYSRNRIRNSVIPQLERVSARTVFHITKAGDFIREADEYLQSQADELYTECVTKAGRKGPCVIDTESFNTAPHILKGYVVRRILKEQSGRWKDISSVNIDDIIGLCEKQSGKRIELPCGLLALKTGDRLKLGKKEDLRGGPSERPRVEFELADYGAHMGFPEKNYTKWIDYDKIKNGLCVRTRREGDRITIDSELHRQAFKKYLINEKIPVNERDSLLLVADGSDIVWVIGGRLSEGYKLGPSSERAVIINVIGGLNNE